MKLNQIRIALCCLLFLTAFSFSVKAQDLAKFNTFQDSLIKISNGIGNIHEKEIKVASNAHFVKTLVEALKMPNSFAYPFDSLKNVSILKSADKKFRIFSWYLAFEDGTYKHYGAIQMNTANGALKLYPLMDQTENIKDLNATTTNLNWIGARYYEMIPIVSSKTEPYYILLGWKGNTSLSTKKIIEILKFNADGVVFGASNFDGQEYNLKNRILFQYTKENAMTLKSDRKADMIVFDNLIPLEPKLKGNFDYYVSDGTMNGFKIIGGKLKYVDHIDLKNEADVKDDLFADPTKNNKPIRKF